MMITEAAPQIADLVDFLKSELGISEATAVDVTLVDEDVMTDLHMRYMGLPGPTDVLSFPAIEVSGALIDPASLRDEPTLGDIVICPEFITRNTQSDPTQLNIDSCVIHGTLHLLGYDHQTEENVEAMVVRQEALTKLWRNQQQRPFA